MVPFFKQGEYGAGAARRRPAPHRPHRRGARVTLDPAGAGRAPTPAASPRRPGMIIIAIYVALVSHPPWSGRDAPAVAAGAAAAGAAGAAAWAVRRRRQQRRVRGFGGGFGGFGGGGAAGAVRVGLGRRVNRSGSERPRFRRRGSPQRSGRDKREANASEESMR